MNRCAININGLDSKDSCSHVGKLLKFVVVKDIANLLQDSILSAVVV
jgi:hypothetical protein